MPKVVVGAHDPGTLENLAKRLSDASGALIVLRALMIDNQLEELTLKYQSETMKAIRKIETFTAQGMAQLKKAREEKRH